MVIYPFIFFIYSLKKKSAKLNFFIIALHLYIISEQ